MPINSELDTSIGRAALDGTLQSDKSFNKSFTRVVGAGLAGMSAIVAEVAPVQAISYQSYDVKTNTISSPFNIEAQGKGQETKVDGVDYVGDEVKRIIANKGGLISPEQLSKAAAEQGPAMNKFLDELKNKGVIAFNGTFVSGSAEGVALNPMVDDLGRVTLFPMTLYGKDVTKNQILIPNPKGVYDKGFTWSEYDAKGTDPRGAAFIGVNVDPTQFIITTRRNVKGGVDIIREAGNGNKQVLDLGKDKPVWKDIEVSPNKVVSGAYPSTDGKQFAFDITTHDGFAYKNITLNPEITSTEMGQLFHDVYAAAGVLDRYNMKVSTSEKGTLTKNFSFNSEAGMEVVLTKADMGLYKFRKNSNDLPSASVRFLEGEGGKLKVLLYIPERFEKNFNPTDQVNVGWDLSKMVLGDVLSVMRATNVPYNDWRNFVDTDPSRSSVFAIMERFAIEQKGLLLATG